MDSGPGVADVGVADTSTRMPQTGSRATIGRAASELLMRMRSRARLGLTGPMIAGAGSTHHTYIAQRCRTEARSSRWDTRTPWPGRAIWCAI